MDPSAQDPKPDAAVASRATSFRLAFVAGLVHAVLMWAASAPLAQWGWALAAPVPLIWIAARRASSGDVPISSRGRVAGLLSRWRVPLGVTLGVIPLWAYECQWVINISEFGYFPMVVALALFSGAFVGLLSRARRRVPWMPLWIAAPVLWTGLEVFRGEVVVTGYAWLLLGHPLIDSAPGPLLASVVGAYGVSFLVCLLAAAACAVPLAQERAVRFGVGALAVVGVAGLALPWMFATRPRSGSMASASSERFSVRIGVVQTNVPQDNKLGWTIESRERDFARMVELTRQAGAADPKPDLIVWPETMFPGEMLEPIEWPDGKGGVERRPLAPAMVEELFALQREIDIPLMVGALGVEGGRIARGADAKAEFRFDRRFNSVFLIERGELSGRRYDKMELTPFGEVMPYVHHWPWLERMVMGVAASGMKFDLAAGEVPESFRLYGPRGRPVRLATPICFEITKSAHLRTLFRGWVADIAKHPPPLLVVNLSNDGWFGDFDAGRRQHLMAARWRAAEYGIPVVRAVNTGISCAIDASGRVETSGAGAPPANRTDGVLVADVVVGPPSPDTPFFKIGNKLGWGSLIASGMLAMLSMLRWSPRGERSNPR